MKNIISFPIVIFPLILFSQSTHFIINGESKSLNNKSRIYLKSIDRNDTSECLNGKFQFLGTTMNPDIARIYVDEDGSNKLLWTFPIFLAGGIINIDISDIGKSVENIKLSGNSISTDYQYKLFFPVRKLVRQREALKLRLDSAKQSYASDTLKLEDEIQESITKCFQVPKDFIKANPSSLVAIEALKMLGNGDQPKYPVTRVELGELFNLLTLEIRNSIGGIKYAENLKKWSEGMSR